MRYANFYVKNLRKNNDKMTQFHWSRKSRDGCPTSSGLVRDSRFGQLSNPLVRYLPGSKFVIEPGNYNETFTCDRVKRYLPLVTFKN